jgi:hypothetical protein
LKYSNNDIYGVSIRLADAFITAKMPMAKNRVKVLSRHLRGRNGHSVPIWADDVACSWRAAAPAATLG